MNQNHNPCVVGSNPTAATISSKKKLFGIAQLHSSVGSNCMFLGFLDTFLAILLFICDFFCSQ